MNPTEDGKDKAAQEQGQSDNESTSIVGARASHFPEDPPTDQRTARPRKKHEWTRDPPMFWVSVAGVIVVFLYTSVAAWQAYLTRDQLGVLQRQLDATERTERASFQFGDIKFVKKVDNDPHPLIDFSFFNSGRTVAVISEFNMECRLIKGGTDIGLPIYDAKRTRGGGAAVGPSSFIGADKLDKCKFDSDFSESDYADIGTHKKWIMVFGYIKYTTVFGSVYKRGFGVLYIADRDFFTVMTVDLYNYDRKEN